MNHIYKSLSIENLEVTQIKGCLCGDNLDSLKELTDIIFHIPAEEDRKKLFF